MFKAIIRQIGTSAGILIPKEILDEDKLKIGDEVDVGILKLKLEILEKAFGMAKGKKLEYVRDKRDRI